MPQPDGRCLTKRPSGWLPWEARKRSACRYSTRCNIHVWSFDLGIWGEAAFDLPFTGSSACGLKCSLHSSFTYARQHAGDGKNRFYSLLRLQNQVGSFEIGKDFDALMIDASSGNTFDIFPSDSLLEIFEKFVNLGDDRCIRAVWVQGGLLSWN